MTKQTDWKFKGSAGVLIVWHAGANLYYVTNGQDGEIVFQAQQFGVAFSKAQRLNEAQPNNNLVAAAKQLNKIEFIHIR